MSKNRKPGHGSASSGEQNARRAPGGADSGSPMKVFRRGTAVPILAVVAIIILATTVGVERWRYRSPPQVRRPLPLQRRRVTA